MPCEPIWKELIAGLAILHRKGRTSEPWTDGQFPVRLGGGAGRSGVNRGRVVQMMAERTMPGGDAHEVPDHVARVRLRMQIDGR